MNNCCYCNSDHFEIVNSYKHHWFVCMNCQNVVRRLKSKLPLDFFKFLSKIIPQNIAKLLWHEDAVQMNYDLFYEYYKNAVLNGSSQTKWHGQLDLLKKKFNEAKLNIESPVIDISGGPGFLIKELNQQGVDGIATELNETAVQAMREALNIKCVTFDYNKHSLSDRVKPHKFKTVLIRASINFCHDLTEFCKNLNQIVVEDGVVYVDFTAPTFGTCLRWQHDEYTYERLWHPHTVRQYFEMAGFKLVYSNFHPPYHAFKDKFIGFGNGNQFIRILLRTLFTSFFTLPYLLRGAFLRSINRSMQQRGIEYIFKKS